MHYRSLLRDLELANGTLVHHLQALQRERLIRPERQRLHLRFYAVGQSPASFTRVEPEALSAKQLAILAHVRGNPGTSQSGAAEALGMSRQAFHYHVRMLAQKGLLAVEAQGRETALRLSPDAEARLRRCGACAHEWLALDATAVQCPACGGGEGPGSAPAAA